MSVYYEQDGITIYHGKAEIVLPHLSTHDLLLTDPPYGIGEAKGKNASRSKLAIAKNFGRAEWDDNPPPGWLLEQAISLTKHQIIFGGNYFGLSPSSCWLVWDKENGESDFADCELAWTNLRKAVRRFKWRWAGMLQEDMSDKEYRWHPTQKPVAVMTWAIKQAPAECKTILDPFMGSGTTLVAAKLAGLSATGIEQNERYCEAAAKRLAQGVLPFTEAAPRKVEVPGA